MFDIHLNNGKTFQCDIENTIFDAAKNSGIVLEHSCLSARCRSCMVKVLEGKTVNKVEEYVISEDEKNDGYVLSCNSKPISSIKLDVEDLGNVNLSKSRVVPGKINELELVSPDILKVSLRLPPHAKFTFLAGQYVNIIRGNLSRSYSIAKNHDNSSMIEFFIKNYENGAMSHYWFKDAKPNDLLRLEGPLGTFFLRDKSEKKIVFLATGTGIAPIKSILEQMENEGIGQKTITVIWGARHENSLFLKSLPLKGTDFISVLSRPKESWKGKKGYVQDVLTNIMKDFSDCQVYACGSKDMIESAKKKLIEKGLPKHNFYSDAFVSSN